MENRNLIIALVLMLVVWVAFTVFFPTPQKGQGPPVTQKSTESQLALQPKNKTEVKAKAVVAQPLSGQSMTPIVAARGERDLTIDTDLFRAVFTNAGARLKSLKLKKYFVSTSPGAAKVSLVDVKDARLASLRTSGSDGLKLPADALFSISIKDNSIRLQGNESRDIVFSYKNNNGLVLQKIYTLYGDSYKFGLKLRLVQEGVTPVSGRVDLSLVHPWNESMEGGRYSFVGPVSLVGEKVKTEKVKDLKDKPITYQSDLVWTAFENKFFIGAVVPLKNAATQVHIQNPDGIVENTLQSPPLTLDQGQAVTLDYLLYFGPRDLDILKKVDHQLNKAIDFGFFGPIARPLLSFLKFFYRYVGNYGVAIILLTVIIKLLFWPLTQKSYTSMKAMQTLQPQMQKIREKHKNDKERLNKEIMELYKKNRVNPLGGCLPMIIQIPVFFALYEVLLRSIALRQAPFIFWLTDLSSKDPYYITPIIMGVTMFIQQKMSPTTMDPTQAKLFLAMPIVFTFLFLNFPSGLVVYWLVNNLLTILQQYFINRKPQVA